MQLETFCIDPKAASLLIRSTRILGSAKRIDAAYIHRLHKEVEFMVEEMKPYYFLISNRQSKGKTVFFDSRQASLSFLSLETAFDHIGRTFKDHALTGKFSTEVEIVESMLSDKKTSVGLRKMYDERARKFAPFIRELCEIAMRKNRQIF